MKNINDFKNWKSVNETEEVETSDDTVSRIFLGGTWNETTWRDTLIEKLDDLDKIEYFNPIVKDWSEEDIKIENDEKENKCNIHLYVITSVMTGVYSIAEAVHSSHSDKYIFFHIITEGFDEGQLKSLSAVSKLIESNGGTCTESEDENFDVLISDLKNIVYGVGE